MSREMVGAFIDAVYAIALTILALEVPGELDGAFSLERFGAVLLEYAVAFTILFAFWYQHRRIAGVVAVHERGTLWLNALVLLLVCIVPRATTLVFDYGGDVTASQIRNSLWSRTGLSTAQTVDLFYVVVVVSVDLALLLLLHCSANQVPPGETAVARSSKWASSMVLIFVVSLSFMLPVENRYFLLALPVMLFFEPELVLILKRARATRST